MVPWSNAPLHPGRDPSLGDMTTSGFDDARPDLPIAGAVWDAAKRYSTSGPTVIEQLFIGLKKLEAEVDALRRGKS